jgi:hypothetical protein
LVTLRLSGYSFNSCDRQLTRVISYHHTLEELHLTPDLGSDRFFARVSDILCYGNLKKLTVTVPEGITPASIQQLKTSLKLNSSLQSFTFNGMLNQSGEATIWTTWAQAATVFRDVVFDATDFDSLIDSNHSLGEIEFGYLRLDMQAPTPLREALEFALKVNRVRSAPIAWKRKAKILSKTEMLHSWMERVASDCEDAVHIHFVAWLCNKVQGMEMAAFNLLYKFIMEIRAPCE